MSFVELKTLPPKEIVAGFTARAIHTGNLTLMYLTVEAGAVMPQHSHPHEQVSHVISGTFEMTVAGETQMLEPGRIAVIGPNVPHGGRAITQCHLLDVFRPERDDYKW